MRNYIDSYDNFIQNSGDQFWPNGSFRRRVFGKVLAMGHLEHGRGTIDLGSKNLRILDGGILHILPIWSSLIFEIGVSFYMSMNLLYSSTWTFFLYQYRPSLNTNLMFTSIWIWAYFVDDLGPPTRLSPRPTVNFDKIFWIFVGSPSVCRTRNINPNPGDQCWPSP